ncbi:cytochrome P450 [Streptomyces sp. NPDC093252]|uniref:cytochrome P450 n=1 Tax=Streptomyces sp. NPDC093252 TaxID=3154980 RepID=UPI0034403C6C
MPRLPGELSTADRAQLLQRLVLSTVGFTGVTLERLVLLGIRHGCNTPAVPSEEVRESVPETPRLYPPAWRLMRVATADHEVAGVRVHEGEHALIGTHAMHQSATVWDRPLEFLPSRWRRLTNDQRRTLPAPPGGGTRLTPPG